MSGCKIGKVKLKGGGAEVRVIDPSNHNFRRIDLGWGELVVRVYDGGEITNESLVYAIEAAKQEIMFGDE